MSVEIPTDLIRAVQTQIREQLGIPQYDRDSLPSLPSIEDVIAELDPSPAYLRCKRCKGRLLSGVQSLFCVYCGAERHDPEVPPEPIKFKSTFGYRWLLDALKLDGSEIVGQVKEENGSDRSQALPKKEELTVSELLDLEISWLERPKEVIGSVTDSQLAQDKSPVNMAGVDIENFFPSSQKGVFASSSKGPEASAQNASTERSVAQGYEDVDLFANIPSVEGASEGNQEESGDVFSDWASEFQSGNNVESTREGDSFGLFGVPSSNISAQMGSVFGSVKDFEVYKTTGDPAPSTTNNWDENDLWSNFRSDATGQPELLVTSTMETEKDSRNGFPSNESDDWVIDDQWQTSSVKAPGNVKVDEGNDSFDVWNDFATSTDLQNHVPASDEQLPPESHASGINLFNSSNDLQDSDFGDFSQADLFSSDHPNSSKRANHLHSETSVYDKMVDLNGKSEKQDGESMDEVEKIMSQMHDLSFMLESNLSIPKT